MHSNTVILLGTLLILSLILGGYLMIKYLRMREKDLRVLNRGRKRRVESEID